jgi:hypothetical protein
VGKIGNGESNYKEVAKSKKKTAATICRLLKDFDFDLDKGSQPSSSQVLGKFAPDKFLPVWDFREDCARGAEAEGHSSQIAEMMTRHSGEIKALRITGQVEEAEAVAEAMISIGMNLRSSNSSAVKPTRNGINKKNLG